MTDNMKRCAAIILTALFAVVAVAQENIHYQWLESYATNTGSNDSFCINPKKVDIPGIPGYNAYTADLHVHTIFSDAHVSPTERVYEAKMQGIDVLAITDHHPWPRRPFGMEDMNAGYDEAAEVAGAMGVKLIRGLEITGYEPVGHINILFVKDANEYKMSNPFPLVQVDSLLDRAKAEEAFVTTNHPGWPDQNSFLSDFIVERIMDGRINGIEIFNNKEFYPMAIDHANKYNLAMLSCTDCHWSTNFLFDTESDNRDLTIVFAKDTTDVALKEALNARRTIAWADGKLAGREELMLEFLHACVQVDFIREEGNFVRFRLLNKSSIPFLITTENPQELIKLPANGYAEARRRKASLQKSFKVENMYIGSTQRLEIPLAFLLQGNSEVSMPTVKESSIQFSDDGMELSLRCSGGTTYYTLDGSEPDAQSPVYDSRTIKLSEPATVRAVTVNNGKKSKEFSTRMGFSLATKCKGRKPGVHFKYFENDSILSTTHIETIGVLKKEGVYPDLVITDGIGKDHFGFIFTGFISIPESGLYSFKLTTNDGSDLFIGGELACDNDQHNGLRTAIGSIYLQKGFHPYKIRYFEGYGGESFDIFWCRPGSDIFEPVPTKEILFLE